MKPTITPGMTTRRVLRSVWTFGPAVISATAILAAAQVQIEIAPANAQVQIQVQAGQVQIAPAPVQVAPAKPAAKPAPGNAVAPAVDAAQPADAAPKAVDEKLEKEIADLKKQLGELKKGTPAYDLKAAELKRRETELNRKKLEQQRKEQVEELQSKLATGAGLDTDEATDELLERARVYASEDQFRYSIELWQHVLNEKTGLTDRLPSDRALAKHKRLSHAAGQYRPVRDLVELELSSLPDSGLSEYRIGADADARAILAAGVNGSGDIAALTEVVRRFFISSLGDDAAWRLSGILMDEGDFIGARRLLDKIAHVHPDPSIPRGDLLVRLAMASARAGDGAGARDALAKIDQANGADLPESWLTTVKREAERGGPAVGTLGEAVEGWPMALGRASRDGIMAGPPGKPVTDQKLWTEQPVFQFDYKVPEMVSRNQMMGGNQQSSQSRSEIVGRWETGGWSPTSQAILANGQVFFKTHNELRWYDLATRKLVDKVEQEQIKVDANSRVWIQNYYYGPQKPNWPTTQEEISHFGDRVARSMTLVGDTLYHIEGRLMVGGPGAKLMLWNNGKQSSMSMIERLCAVDVTDAGKNKRVRWRFPAAEEGGDMRFMGPPTPAGNRLLVPVLKNNELHLIALDPGSGKQVWSTLLCMPGNQSSRWATVGVSVVGSEAYVASGYGVVFGVESGTGDILWAVRYERSKSNTADASRGGVVFRGAYGGSEILPGFDDDAIIPAGDRLIITASDADSIYCLSRVNGKMLWRTPRYNATYCLGVLEDGVFVGGKSSITRYSIASGKKQWEEPVAESLGRGALTPTGVYVPVKNEIARLETKEGKRVGMLKIASSSRDPIGNVYCDGKNLVAAGLDRIYAMVDGDAKMIELTAAIEKKDSAQARLDRAFLYEVVGNHDASVNDLRVAVNLMPAGDGRGEASRKLLMQLLDLAKSKPDKALATYEEAERVAAPIGQQVRVWIARGRWHVSQNQNDAALDLFLKAAQDPTEALVVMDDAEGRREARASVAASAEIRALAKRHGAVVTDALNIRGKAALKVHTDMAAMESLDVSKLPVALDASRLEAEAAKLKKEREELQARASVLASQRDRLARLIESEKKTSTGQLETLEKDHAKAIADLKPLSDQGLVLAAALVEKEKQAAAARQEASTIQKTIAELKASKPLHAERLRALAAMYADSTVSLEATLLAARYLRESGAFERSELLLKELSDSSNRRVAASGLAELARTYTQRGWPRQAIHTWAKVKRDFADEVIVAQGQSLPAGQIADKELAALPALGEMPLVDRRLPSPPYEKIWSEQHNGQYFIMEADGEDDSAFLEDHLLMFSQAQNRMVCRDLVTGKETWGINLKKSNVNSSSTANGRAYQINNFFFNNGKLQRSGHVGVLWTPQEVTAIGLADGKELWRVPAVDGGGTNRNPYGYYNPYGGVWSMSVASNAVIEIGVNKDRGQTIVRALDLSSGSVRWVNEFDRENISGVMGGDKYVGVFVNAGAEMLVCDVATGERLGRIKLDNRQQNAPMRWTKHGLLVLNMQGATLYGLPGGEKKWNVNTAGRGGRVVFSGNMRAEFLDDDRVALMNQGVFIVDLKTGNITAEATGAEMGQYVYDMAVTPDGSEIFTMGNSQQGHQIISVVDGKTGKIKMTLSHPSQQGGMMVQLSRIASTGDLMPALIMDPPEDRGNGQKIWTGKATLSFWRKSDGKRMDVQLPGGPDALKFQNGQSPMVRGNVLLVQTYQQITAYRRVPGAPQPELKIYEPPKPDPNKKDEKKAENPQAQPGIQILPGRIIRGGIKIVPAVPAKPAEEKKDDKKEEKKDEKKDEKKAGAPGGAGGAVIIRNGDAIIQSIEIEIDEAVPAPAPPKKEEPKPQEK